MKPTQTPAPETEQGLLGSERESLARPPTLCLLEESVLVRHGDYWTVQYQGQTACLKATRGLQYLASLLEQPGREFHVSEIIAPDTREPVAAGAGLVSGISKEDESQMRSVRFHDAGPILDARAKAEYGRRLAELRGELEQAERLNDPERAERVRQERDCIADQLLWRLVSAEETAGPGRMRNARARLSQNASGAPSTESPRPCPLSVVT